MTVVQLLIIAEDRPVCFETPIELHELSDRMAQHIAPFPTQQLVEIHGVRRQRLLS